MCLCEVVPLPTSKKPRPPTEGSDIAPSATPTTSSREKLSNIVVERFEMQRKVKEVRIAYMVVGGQSSTTRSGWKGMCISYNHLSEIFLKGN